MTPDDLRPRGPEPDDYLWDRSGPADPTIDRVEHALSSLAHRPIPLELPAPRGASRFEWLLRLPAPARVAFAAALVVASVFGGRVLTMRWASGRGFEVVRVAGEVRLARAGERGGAAGARRTLAAHDRLRRGEWLETGPDAGARLTIGTIGVVEVGSRSRVRLLETTTDDHRLSLAEGELRAIIIAPPRRFFVETPAALAVDLGCAYTLNVAPSGASNLSVDIGWVSLEAEGRESFIPAGARCISLPGRPPGTPCFNDASAALKNALHAFDFGIGAASVADSALAIVVSESRREDALTLWHLLSRTRGAVRGSVFDALAARVPPPPAVTRAGILAGERGMFDAWWDALGYGDTAAWRRWLRPWSDVAAGPAATSARVEPAVVANASAR
ncbi:MAG: hypothetical protein HOP12_05405 [Candidatus Eisenbacteria bacterium]|uniref:FecR protein domain-containing protein n=1 Tax=Eiseniibacteriota bacterium TaxID=2212470 RepID=A0A849SIZ6_UNCEI|nr:hypothetical protein [Candidatus Eisenbacteria bacterium]